MSQTHYLAADFKKIWALQAHCPHLTQSFLTLIIIRSLNFYSNTKIQTVAITACEVLRQRETDGKDGQKENDNDQVMPPGAAASWNVVDNDEDQTTSKSTNVIVVTSPVSAVFT